MRYGLELLLPCKSKGAFFAAALLLWAGGALFSQTRHPLLIAALDSAERIPYGAYHIRAVEKHHYSKDTIFYLGRIWFERFEHLDGKPGLRYEADLETQYPSSLHRLRVVFDGRYKYSLYGDTLAQRYDLQRLDPDVHLFQNGTVFFFIPMLLHAPAVNRYYGQNRDFGTPPYQTLDDTLISNTPCILVGADWTTEANEAEEARWRHIRFGIDKQSGLPIYFRYQFGGIREPTTPSHSSYLLEIVVGHYDASPPKNSFYIDWQSLPKTYEVREFFDCYNREILRPRHFEGL